MNVARAVLAFLALPGTVAFVVPLLIADRAQPFDSRGFLLLAPATAGLL